MQRNLNPLCTQKWFYYRVQVIAGTFPLFHRFDTTCPPFQELSVQCLITLSFFCFSLKLHHPVSVSMWFTFCVFTYLSSFESENMLCWVYLKFKQSKVENEKKDSVRLKEQNNKHKKSPTDLKQDLKEALYFWRSSICVWVMISNHKVIWLTAYFPTANKQLWQTTILVNNSLEKASIVYRKYIIPPL